VENDESEATVVNISLADWDRSIDGENRFFEPGTLPRSSAGWITLSPTQFELGPGEMREVRFTVTVPEGVEGTYWAAILVEGAPREVEISEGTTIIVRKRFGIKVYETPPGTGRRDGRILKLQRLGFNPLTFLIAFENTGTLDLQVSGEVEVIDSQGQMVEEIPVAQFPILPGAVREVRAVGTAPRPAAGRYYALAVLDFGSPDYLPAGQLIFDIPELELVPIGDAENPPQDLDHDGFYGAFRGRSAIAAMIVATPRSGSYSFALIWNAYRRSPSRSRPSRQSSSLSFARTRSSSHGSSVPRTTR
jgi:hypothetical protein